MALMRINEVDITLNSGLPVSSALLILGVVATGKNCFVSNSFMLKQRKRFKCTHSLADHSPLGVRTNMRNLG